jgi:hypothetical protein
MSNILALCVFIILSTLKSFIDSIVINHLYYEFIKVNVLINKLSPIK